MDEAVFDPATLRMSANPPISRAEMARRIGVSNTFIFYLERGLCRWPAARKAAFLQVIATWDTAEGKRTRKPRSDKGQKHRKTRRKRRVAQASAPAPELVPVAHAHGEVVGIG